MAATNMPAEAMAIETVCNNSMSTTIDTQKTRLGEISIKDLIVGRFSFTLPNKILIAMADKESFVRKGYDEIAEEYHTKRNSFDHEKELKEFAALLPKNAKILDVGCGAGVPVARFLVEFGFEVTGIDFSENMLRLARKNVPKAVFIKKNMNQLDFLENSFDGLAAFYSIIHVPREKHSSLFESFHRVLKPDGIMLVCMGPDEWEATDEYLGTTMFWSHYTPEKSLQLVKDAGFQIIYDKILTSGGERHYWIMARNRK